MMGVPSVRGDGGEELRLGDVVVMASPTWSPIAEVTPASSSSLIIRHR